LVTVTPLPWQVLTTVDAGHAASVAAVPPLGQETCPAADELVEEVELVELVVEEY
jgi:hypothetical protein